MTLTLVTLAITLVPTPSQIVRVLRNGIIWIAVFGIHFVLFALKMTHRLVQIRPIQFALKMLIQSTLARICLFWPRFYYSLLYKKKGRSLWEIITNPVPPNGKKDRWTHQNSLPKRKTLLPLFLSGKRGLCLCPPQPEKRRGSRRSHC